MDEDWLIEVAEETRSYHGRELEVLFSQLQQWHKTTHNLYQRLTKYTDTQLPAFTPCALESARDLDTITHLIIRGCYRQAGTLLRSALNYW